MRTAYNRVQGTVRDLESLHPAIQRIRHTTRQRTLVGQLVGELTPPIENRTVVAARRIVARHLLGHATSVPNTPAARNPRHTTFGLTTRCDFGEVHRRRRSRPRLAIQNDTLREQPGPDNKNMPRSVTKRRDLRVVRHHAHDANSRCRHHFRHHTQQARRLRTGPHLQFRWWRRQHLNLRPSGYEPTQCRTFWSRLLLCSTADEAIRATFVTSSPVQSLPVRRSTAPRAMHIEGTRRVVNHRTSLSIEESHHTSMLTGDGAEPESDFAGRG